MYDNGDVDNYRHGQCIHFHDCKRIDHKIVRFAVPWFKSYDNGQFSGCICSEFEPAEYCVYAKAHWAGFDKEWAAWVDQWLPYKNTNKNIFFTLHGNTDVRYGVKLLDFVFGNMFDGDILKANEKVYYKRDKSNPIGYTLIHEKIDGVKI